VGGPNQRAAGRGAGRSSSASCSSSASGATSGAGSALSELASEPQGDEWPPGATGGPRLLLKGEQWASSAQDSLKRRPHLQPEAAARSREQVPHRSRPKWQDGRLNGSPQSAALDAGDKLELQGATSGPQESRRQFVLDPAGQLYQHWSMVVSLAFLYNFWAISYRFSFQEIELSSVAFWFALDYAADLIYLVDVLVNMRTGYLEEGVLQRNIGKIGHHYRECTRFYLDCFCLLPLDILYLSFSFNSILRFPRLVKIYKFWSYTDRTERHTNYPNVYRTFTLVHYILVIFHWNACLFHMISKRSK